MSADSAGKTGCQNQGGIAVAPSLCGLGLFLCTSSGREAGGCIPSRNIPHVYSQILRKYK
ncbi:hypothetical protein DXB77_08635 [Clostridium sp. OM05-9]|nr:hypothetical protein DXB77_08635 [Clostridium sp. OM05-9]